MNEKELNENIQATNKLLLDMVQNQKEGNKNLTKSFITMAVCLTVIIVAMIIGFFVYESQFEVVGTTETSTITQDADNDGSGDIIMNNGGDLNYGESKTDSN